MKWRSRSVLHRQHLPKYHGMDPRVSATAFGQLRPRMTKALVFAAMFSVFAWPLPFFIATARSSCEASGDFVILGRSRSVATCADPRIHASTVLLGGTFEVSASGIREGALSASSAPVEMSGHGS